MGTGDQVGKIGTCSECNQEKKISLEWDNGTNKKGINFTPYLRCEECVALFKDEDKM